MIDILQLVVTTLTVCIVQAAWTEFREKMKNRKIKNAPQQRKTRKAGKRK